MSRRQFLKLLGGTVLVASSGLRAQEGGAEGPPLRFGALTRVGEGGVPLDLPEGEYGAFQVQGGLLTPRLSPLNVETVTIGDLQIEIVADMISVRGTDELRAIIREEALINNRTVQYRGDASYGQINAFGAFDTSILTGRVVIEPDRLFPNPWTWFSDAGPETHGNYTLRNVRFGRDMSPEAHNFLSPVGVSVPGGTRRELANISGTGAILEGCEFFSNARGTKQGGLLIEHLTAIEFGGHGNILRDCYIHDIITGPRITATDALIEGNRIHRIFNDFMRVDEAHNTTIRNNDCGGILGLGCLLHQDGIQFTGDASDLVIEGNVFYPGAFIETCITNANDPQIERIPVSADTTLDAATFNGNVARISAEGLTLTLPAAPELGDSYWFETASPATMTTLIQANAGQSHGDGLLPRTVSNAANNGTFQVYWDGHAWQTLYGIRAGIHVIEAGARTLTGQFNRKMLLCDASAGDIVLTLPPVTQMPWGVGVLRRDASPHRVILRPNAADRFVFRDRDVPALEITQDQAYMARNLRRPGQFDIREGQKGEIQGIFGNAFDYDNIRIRGNVIWSNASHGLRLEADFPAQVIENNTFLRSFPADQTGDGVIDGMDGFFTTAPSNVSPHVRMLGDGAGSTDRRAQRNMNVGVYDFADQAETVAFNAENIGLAIGTATAFPAEHFNGTEPADYYPTTREEALEMALARPGGPLDGTFIGALGTTPHNGFWDFEAGQQNPRAPDSLRPAPPSGWGAAWVQANPGTNPGEIDLVLAFACYSNPPLTAIEVELDGSGQWEVLPDATERGPHTLTKADGGTYTLTGIRGVNALGPGAETPLAIGVRAGFSGLDFTDSVVNADYNSPQWNTGDQVIEGGWLIAPTAGVRSDTNTGQWAITEAGALTAVVDFRVTRGGVLSNVGIRVLNATTGQGPAVSVNLVNRRMRSDGADAAGYGVVRRGVFRLWAKIRANPGDRIVLDFPRAANANIDFTNPALFQGDLSQAEILGLA